MAKKKNAAEFKMFTQIQQRTDIIKMKCSKERKEKERD